jgi:hypothetical protein
MLGDFAVGATVDGYVTTRFGGVPTTLAGTPAVSVYKDNGTTESTAGVTLTTDFDGRTGLNQVRIDTSADATFYASGSSFAIVLTAGTVGGQSVVGCVIEEFSLLGRSLTPTNVATAVWAAATRTLSSGAITASTFAANALDAVWSTATRLLTAGTNIALAKGTGVTGFNDLSAAEVNAEADTALADAGVTTTVTGRIDAAVSSRSTYAGADTSGTTTLLARLTSTRAALLDNLDALISSRLATSGYTAPANATIASIYAAVDTEIATILTAVAAIQAQTDLLPATPAATGDAMTLTSGERTAIADAHLDRADAIETGLTPRGAQRVIAAAVAGKASGMADLSPVFRNAVADTKDRITATTNADGDRLTVTVDAT